MEEDEATSSSTLYQYSPALAPNTVVGELVRLIGRGKRMLEVGCGPGSQSKIYNEQLECSIVGIEIDPLRASRARQFCERVIEMDLDSPAFAESLKDDTFDVILFADVLEHLRNPLSAIKRLVPFLRPDGCILASIPNITHASVVFEMARGRFLYRRDGILDETHIRFFCRESVISLFHDAQLVVADLIPIRRNPKHTEFASNPDSESTRALLNLIVSSNEDADTYQFIVRALPKSHPSLHSMLESRVFQLSDQLRAREKEVTRLRSAIDWLETPWTVRLRAKAKTFFRANRS